jgi:hypothetical protein
MRNKRRNVTTRWTEEDIQTALRAIRAGKTIREAIKDSSIPLSTIWRRHNGGDSWENFQQNRQVLSSNQEARLVDWLLNQLDNGLYITHEEICKRAKDVWSADGLPGSPKVTRSWALCFLNRYPELKEKKRSSKLVKL